MTNTNARIANLSPEKQALLAKLLKEKAQNTHSAIPKRQQFSPCPLSFAQERLWFLAQMDGDSPFYNIAGVVQLQGKLNTVALEQALNQLIYRHEVLRTVFLMAEQPEQVIVAYNPMSLLQVDLTGLSAELQKKAVADIEHQEAHQVFDLTQAPLLRATLLKLNVQHYQLLMTLHHIVSDEWSLNLFIQELSEFYQTFVQSEVLTKPELGLQYADFACWQRDYLQGERQQKQLAYWATRLKDIPQLLELSIAKPRPAEMSYRGASYRFQLTSAVSEGLHTLARTTDSTLFVLSMAIFASLLQRYSGQNDICIGYPVANRNRRDIENLIGFFVNTQVLRSDLSENPRFIDVLAQIKQHILEAQNHQDIPFEQLVDELKPERSLNHTPLFQVMLALQNAAMPVLSLPDLTLSIDEVELNSAKFDLTLTVINQESSLICDWNYSTDLFNESDIAKLAMRFQILAQAIIAQPQARIAELPLITASEQQQLTAWNNAAVVDYTISTNVTHLIEQQVEKTPTAIAVLFEQQQLDYETLNQKANQLAHYLISVGVKADARVAICMERSLDMVIAVLAILKAGGAYLPLDPNYPKERLAYMLQDAQPVALLTHSHLQVHLPTASCKTILLDAEQAMLANYSLLNPTLAIQAHDLAYIIYTSGSTGQAKAVMIEHGSVVNLLQDIKTRYQLCATDRSLQFASLAFDASVEEIFGALTSGAVLVLRTDAWLTNATEFWALCERYALTVVSLSTLFWQQLTQEQSIVIPDCIRNIIIGGEAVSHHALASWFKRESYRPVLFNTYGPTESTVNATVHIPTTNDLSWQSIGHATSNTCIYILDDYLQLLPIGLIGEIYIGGVGLARGYLHRDELTATRFIQHKTYGRLYKTGDLGRWLEDGTIEYRGRNDFQVKIRGFRIELGEIEAALLSHDLIKEAVVLARTEAGRKQLVAYVIAQQTVSVTDLQAHLKQSLPDYMIPSAFVFLEALPLTANGKLNRQALPAPDFNEIIKNHYVAPQTTIEKTLAEIWRDLLGLSQVGCHDNFFDLGGDSILSIQVVSRARQAGIVFTPKQLFQHQTIAALARVANQETMIAAEQGIVSGQLPLTPIQQWFFAQGFTNPHHWNQALLFEVIADYQPQQITQALQRLLIHHDALRLQFVEQQGSWLQTHLAKVDYPLLVHCDLSSVAPDQQTLALEHEASKQQAQLNLNTGQLVRAVWFNLGNQQNPRLLLIIHHLAVDGVSWRILLEDLSRLLTAQTTLPAKTTSFKQWAELATAHFHSSNKHADYWLAERYQTAVSLPVDNDTGQNTIATEQSISFSLSASETKQLLTEVHRAYQTKIDEVLLTVLTETLCTWSQQSSLLIDLEGHGREDVITGIDISRTVAWFTSVFPVVLCLPEQGHALPFIKEQLRTIPDKGFTYGWLRYANHEIAQQLAALPKASVIFNYLGQFDASHSIGGLRLVDNTVGQLCDLTAMRGHELDIVCHIANGQLQMTWRYSAERHTQTTITALVADYQERLKTLISYCLSPDVGCYTPTDFPLAHLTHTELEQLALTHGQVEDLYSLAPLQQGLLFHSLYAPDSGVYCVQLAFQITGQLHVEFFKQAWQTVLNRHSILRTCFNLHHGKPLQQVNKQVTLPFQLENWMGLSEQEQLIRWQQALAKDSKTPFDFTIAPLMRLGLIQCTEQRYYFYWTHHHVLLDGWSNTLIKEVFLCYDALKNGTELQLPISRPYRDYIAWLQQQDLQAAKRYWQTQLSGFTAPTSFGIDGYQPEIIEGYAKQDVLFSLEQTKQLQNFAKQQHITLNTLVQAAWALLLSRYSGESDIVFGTTVSGRPAELTGVEFMIGLFINSLPMRVQVSEEMTVADWLNILFEQNLELRRYEYTPLVEIQGWSDVPRGLPLFESLLVFENYPIDAALAGTHANQIQQGDLCIENISTQDYSSYPLTLSAFPNAQFKLTITYNLQRFNTASITRLLEHLQIIINAMINQAQAKLFELPLLTEIEQYKLLANKSFPVIEPPTLTIVAWFEQHVIKNPEAIALVFAEQTLSYGELNQRANQLARYLQTQGVQADVLVGVCLERSLEMIIALLAILKAGGAYLPLDPDYPTERLAYMVCDANIALLISQQTLAANLPTLEKPCFYIDSDWQQVNQYRTDNLNLSLHPLNLAYVIYTSGSTGNPKGVMIAHQQVTRLFTATEAQFHFNAQDVWTLFHSFAFDFSVWEIWGALLYGGRLVIVPYWVSRSPKEFSRLLQSEKVTVLNQTPSAFKQLINLEPQTYALRYVIFGGEALDLASLKPWFQYHGEQRPQLINMYGITETTVHVTYREITQRDLELENRSPIGKPISDLQTYLLSPHYQACPYPVRGELFVGGQGVARGYLNRPDLTAERFVPNPFGEAGSRLYKSGDLACSNKQGELDYLGRIDHQVKIRGFRIELGEITAKLLENPAIQHAVVIVREDQAGDKHLVAYLVAQDGFSVSPVLLRDDLAKVLADYMLPSAFVVLPELPLTTNGKLNHNALPAPDSSITQSDYIAPRTATEKIVASLWSELLEVEQVGIQDNFFALGGHSLIATQLISRISKAFTIELPIKTLFDCNTLEQLAEQIDLALWLNSQTQQASHSEFEEIEL